jgi:NAD(P)-dependent dehydrogenase (short-subunit alcohol dehydrogenase family)
VKSILITGAGSGIGRATACLFARRGRFVGLFDADETSLRAVADELGANRCYAGRLDVTATTTSRWPPWYGWRHARRLHRALSRDTRAYALASRLAPSLGGPIMKRIAAHPVHDPKR